MEINIYEAEGLLKDQRIEDIEIYGDVWIKLKDGREFTFVEQQDGTFKADVNE